MEAAQQIRQAVQQVSQLRQACEADAPLKAAVISVKQLQARRFAGTYADLLQGGQGVFGIAVSGAMRELTGAIADFPGERADGGESIESPEDELASRRKQRDRKIG